MKEKLSAVQILKNWAKLAVIVGILPWSYFYVTALAPIVNHALGIDQMRNIKVGVYIFPIIIPPLLLYSLLSKGDGD